MTKHVMLTSAAMPRAIRGGVRSDAGNPAEILAQLNTDLSAFKKTQGEQFATLEKTLADFRAENDTAMKGKADSVVAEKVDRVNAAVDDAVKTLKATDETIKKISAEIDKINEKQAAFIVSGGTKAGFIDPRTQNEHYPAYAKAWNAYFRRGESAAGGENALRDLSVKAAMSVGSDPDGGYTVLPEIETTIDAVVKQISPMRDIATVMQIGTAEYKKLVNQHGTASGWVGELDSRPQTAGSQLSELKFPINEVYAMPAASQSLLDDSYLDIAAWLSGEVQLEFAQKEGISFISGDGVNKPAGFLGAYGIVANASYVWGKIGYIASGGAGAFASTNPADALIDLYHAPKSPYRINSTFTANRTTLGALRKLKDGQGNYLLNMVLRPEGFIEEILGRPAVEMPDMPDIAANSFSIAFGDFKRGYLILDRIGIRVLRDAYTAKPYVLFYTTKRVGGGVQNFEAIKLMKFATS